MNKSALLILKTACWVVVIGFSAVAIGVQRLVVEATRSDAFLWCGNSVTDPIALALNIGTPVSLVAVTLLWVFWRQGFATSWSVLSASFLALISNASILVLGVGFFRSALPGHYLSEIVWWMRPAGEWLGV